MKQQKTKLAGKLLIFDFDGTLADSKKLYVEAIHKFLSKCGYSASKEAISNNLGPLLYTTLKNVNVLEKDLVLLKKEINSYVAKKALSVRLCPHAKETLNTLCKKYKLILMTNSVKPFILKILKRHNLQKYFSELLCAKFRKKEEGFRYLFKKYKTKPKDVTYIADKKEDVKIAKNAGSNVIITLINSWDKRLFGGGEKYVIKNLRELKLRLQQL